MKRRTYGVFDPAHMGPDLELAQGNRVVTFNASSLDEHRMVRSTIALTEDPGSVEFQAFDGVVDGDDGANVILGLVTVDADTSKYVGEDAEGIGYNFATGEVKIGASVVDTFAASGVGDVVKLTYDPVAGRLSFLKNQALLGSITLTLGLTWYFAATVYGDNAFGLSLFVNSGDDAFITPDNTGGWWEPIVGISTARISSEAYMSLATDTRPNLDFDATHGRIVRDDNFYIQSELVFWPDGEGSGVLSSVSQLRIRDPEHYYDWLVTEDARDTPIHLYTIDPDASFDDAADFGEFLIDHVDPDGDDFKVITLKYADILGEPLQPRRIYPAAPEASAGRPQPTLIGCARTFDLTLVDAALKRYIAADEAMHAIGAIRLKGVPLVVDTDFQMSPDLTGFDFLDTTAVPDGEPSGKLTAEASVIGGEFDPGDPDYLSGIGSPFAGADGDLPTGWLARFSSFDPDEMPHADGAGALVFPCQYLVRSNVSENAFPIRAGRSYAWSINITQRPQNAHEGALGGIAGDGDAFLLIAGFFDADGYWLPPHGLIRLDTTGTKTGTFSNTTGMDLILYLSFFNNNSVSGALKVEDFKMVELPDVSENSVLTGAGLEAYVTKVLEQLGGQPATAWDHAAAAAIDAATGYQIGAHFTADTTREEALKPAFDSFTAAPYRRPNGQIGIARLIDPATVDPGDYAFEITEGDIIDGPLVPSQDLAPGIVCSMGVTRNYSPYSSADFPESTTPPDGVPPAERRILERPYQVVINGRLQLAQTYAFGQRANAIGTLFDVRGYGAAELARINAIYQTGPRMNYPATIPWYPGRPLELGTVGPLTYARNDEFSPRWYGLDAKPVMLKMVTILPMVRKARCRWWG